MVFGYLLGGMIKGAGAQMQREREQQHQEDLYKQKLAFDTAAQMLNQRGGDMTPEELTAHMRNLDAIIGPVNGRKDTFASLVPFTQQVVPHLTPPNRVTPPKAGGGVETAGQAPPESIMAPSTVPGQMGGVPQGIPPMPERPTGNVNPTMKTSPEEVPPMPEMPTKLTGTINEQHRQKMLAEIEASDLTPAVKEMAKARIYGANITGYESALLHYGGAQAPRALGGQPTWIQRNGETFPVVNTTQGLMINDQHGNLSPYLWQPGDTHAANGGGKWQLRPNDAGELTWFQSPTTPGQTPTHVGTGVKAPSSSANVDILTPEAKQGLARAIQGGNFEAITQILGRSGGSVKQEIANMVFANNKDLNVSGQRAQFKSLQDALTKITTMKTNVEAFEATALDNIEVLEDKMNKVVDSGITWLNTPLRDIDRGGLSSEDQVGYDAAREVVINEMSKIFSTANLQGGLVTNEMREHVERMLPANATLGQAMEAIRVLKLDMANRIKELNRSVYNTKELLNSLATGEEPKIKERGGKEGESGGGVSMSVSAMPKKFPTKINVMRGGKVIGSRDVASETALRGAQEWATQNGATIQIAPEEK